MATVLFLVLYGLNLSPRKAGILTLLFGAWYGTVRVITDFLRVDKRFFGLTGSQWTGLTVATIWLVPVLRDALGWRWAFAFLAPGPALGIVATLRLRIAPATEPAGVATIAARGRSGAGVP